MESDAGARPIWAASMAKLRVILMYDGRYRMCDGVGNLWALRWWEGNAMFPNGISSFP